MDDVAWESLEHTYGAAGDVPALLDALRNPDTTDDAAGELWASVLHQGSVYTATGPAMRALVRHASDPDTDPETRGNAVGLLTAFADAMTAVEREVGEGGDAWVDATSPALLADLRQAMEDAVALVPLLLREVGASLGLQGAGLAAASPSLPDDAVASLHEAFATARDDDASVALATALLKHDAFTPAERVRLAAAGPAVVFAAAWAAVRAGAAADSVEYERCGALWAGGRSGLASLGVDQEDSILALVEARGADALPLLDVLAGDRSTLREALIGYPALAAASRAATPGVVRSLCRLAVAVADGELGDVDTPWEPEDARRLTPRFDLLQALAGVLPDARELAGTVADLMVASVKSAPRPADRTPFSASGIGQPTDLRADVALALLAVGDDRWQELYVSAQRDLGDDSVMVSTRTSRSPFPNAVSLLRLPRLDVGEVVPFLTANPSVAAAWAEVLLQVPGASAELSDATLIAALPQGTKGVTRLLLARGATDAVPALRERLRHGEPYYGVHTWLVTALAVLAGTHADVAALDELLTSGRIEDADDAYPTWRDHPTPGFMAYRRRVLKECVTDSFYDRLLLLAVVGDLAPEIGVDAVWEAAVAPLHARSLLPWWGAGADVVVPTALALSAEGAPFREALAVGLSALLGPERGRLDPLSAGHSVALVHALFRLGALGADEAVARLLRALPLLGPSTRAGVDALVEIAPRSPRALLQARDVLRTLVEQDVRLDDPIAQDVSAREQLQRGRAQLQGQDPLTRTNPDHQYSDFFW